MDISLVLINFKKYLKKNFLILLKYLKSHKSGKELEKVKDRDKQKEEWCKNNDITLIRVPYTELGHISTFLESSTTILRE